MSHVVSAMVTAEFCMSLPVVESKRATALSVAEAGQTTSHNEASVAFIVIESVVASVVIVTHVPATSVRVSVVVSATTSLCPLTAIVLNVS